MAELTNVLVDFITHETKAHSAQLWPEFHTLSHPSVPLRLRAQRELRRLRVVQLKRTADLQQLCPGAVFNPSRRLHTSVSLWLGWRGSALSGSCLTGAHDSESTGVLGRSKFTGQTTSLAQDTVLVCCAVP